MSDSTVAADELRLLVERVERMNEEAKNIAQDRDEVFAEAKARGFCTKTMRKIIELRAKDKEKLQEEDAMIETYRAALGL